MIRAPVFLITLGLAPPAFADVSQHQALSGPFSVPSAVTTQTADGVEMQAPTAWSDNHWIATPAFYAACPALAAYRDTSAHLARVWSGDDPDNPRDHPPCVSRRGHG